MLPKLGNSPPSQSAGGPATRTARIAFRPLGCPPARYRLLSSTFRLSRPATATAPRPPASPHADPFGTTAPTHPDAHKASLGRAARGAGALHLAGEQPLDRAGKRSRPIWVTIVPPGTL